MTDDKSTPHDVLGPPDEPVEIREVEVKTNSQEHIFRALVRIVYMTSLEAAVMVPGWEPMRLVVVDRTFIPFEVSVGQRVHARVNLNALHKTELGFHEWEAE